MDDVFQCLELVTVLGLAEVLWGALPMEFMLWILIEVSTSLYLASCSEVFMSPILVAILSIWWSISLMLLVSSLVFILEVSESLASEKMALVLGAVSREEWRTESHLLFRLRDRMRREKISFCLDLFMAALVM